ncbi:MULTISPECIES: Ig-like domain-containing protein [Enterococcus]|uniref:Ig-like domain-containing protein n=1 Tax=Enterococcus raffinosus TaxID=71452 RepID=A0AAW8TBU9_9ENTE|nr:Ig-like domain-containing protein [Enterococcus raffinosus]MDT2525728.1 Ig-like domain-containing protein [Enterococcus raffinosus]MDT2536167.1 Ig-like domain-containing protein [Enterococcus raffinosus]MDT2546655.1 Ig-like domain-containing protein [Enterococcus raffinosus]MDT2579969.1 Ig-like domain-containing protein [Enterococcus raffinosus]MDT2592933.1 Ig-like domain-containing protein [Enterococcus raffinosus]
MSPSNVSLNKTTLTLNVGAEETLIATVSPADADDKTVAWKSSDITIATVDTAGKVSAVKEGTAEITVTTTTASKTAKCTLTVTAV